jgi:large subunit ribosomal protein L23
MSVLKKPIISEKMTKAGEKLGHYGFMVEYKANKIQIKQAIEKMYNVTVDRVNTMRMPGKLKTRYTKTGVTSGSTGAYKKAVVTLKKGDTIDFYSNI